MNTLSKIFIMILLPTLFHIAFNLVNIKDPIVYDKQYDILHIPTPIHTVEFMHTLEFSINGEWINSEIIK